MVKRFRDSGGSSKPLPGRVQGGVARPTDEGARIAHQKWPNAGVPGELSQVLPTPRHFEQASQLVTEEMTAKAFVCGNDPDAHLEMIDKYATPASTRCTWPTSGPHVPQGLFELLRGDTVLPRLNTHG